MFFAILLFQRDLFDAQDTNPFPRTAMRNQGCQSDVERISPRDTLANAVLERYRQRVPRERVVSIATDSARRREPQCNTLTARELSTCKVPVVQIQLHATNQDSMNIAFCATTESVVAIVKSQQFLAFPRHEVETGKAHSCCQTGHGLTEPKFEETLPKAIF